MIGDDREDRVIGDGHLIVAEPGVLHLAAEEMITRDRDLLILGVPVEADQLHTVEQWRGDRLPHVRRRNEEHFREVEVDLKVVIAERAVLRRIEHLEQRRGRIASPVTANLVNFVEHDHRVLGAGFFERSNDASRQCADVRAPVPADVRLVVDAAERDPGELPAESTRDRLAEGRLADAGRADQRDDRPGSAAEHGDAPLAAELPDRQELDDALLDVLEAGVVLVEDAPRFGEIEIVLRSDVPGDLEHPVEIRPDPAVLRALLARALKAVQLSLDLGAHVLRHTGVLETAAVACGHVVAAFPELLLDRLELLAQEEVPLGLLHALVDLSSDLLAHRRVGEDILRPPDQAGETLLQVECFEHLELLLDAEVR